MPSPQDTAGTSKPRGRTSKRNSVTLNSAASSATTASGMPAQPPRRVSKIDIKSVDLGISTPRQSSNRRTLPPPVNVAIQSIRKDKDKVFVLIQPNPDHVAVEACLDSITAFCLNNDYRDWHTNGRVAKRLLKEVNLQCQYRIDAATGALQILRAEWPYCNQPKAKRPSLPSRAARHARGAVFSGIIGAAAIMSLGKR